MIDTMYQDGTDAAIRDRLQRPQPFVAPPIGTFAGMWRGTGGAVAGVLDATAAKADEAFGYGQVTAATGTDNSGGMFSLPSDAERAQANAARNKLMTQGVDMNSPAGDEIRAKAKDFMPDPQATGAAGQVIGGLLNFGVQAVGAGVAGPAGLVNLGVDQALTESDRLRLQGVDEGTRTAAGAVAGLGAAGSLLLPMSGASRLIRAGKGAAGGVATVAGQAEAEKLILEHAGYDKIASQYDPLDPVSLALGALVPAGFGAMFGHARLAPGAARAEPTRADVALTPAEQAHSDIYEASAANLRELQQAIDAEKDPANKKILQAEMTKQQAAHDVLPAALRGAADPDVVAAARVRQTADAVDASRLTPDEDLAGHDEHAAAVETASDQLARGDQVSVDMSPFELPPADDFATRLFLHDDGTFSDVPPDSPTKYLDISSEHPALDKGSSGIRLPAELAAQATDVPPLVRLGARIAEVARQVEELKNLRTPPEAPPAPNHAAFHEARAAAEAAPKAGEAKAPEAKAPAKDGAAKPGDGMAPTHLDAATDEILRVNPDAMVQMDGMDAPVRVFDLLEALRASAADDVRDSKLLEVAAQCAITT